MKPKPKAQGMAELRERRRAAGLVKVEAYIRPEDKPRLARYVRQRLGGECAVRSTDPRPD